ncbi:hypothetical protein OIU84_017538 [Salix udensis]|uniref:Uncharacterized protein n=1 Tax=Salix udensis TaxID=889485 RepID=A0AAD6L231_9ROSI|nr:hypothetical protein OIU84_017538 [Salix udensis]
MQMESDAGEWTTIKEKKWKIESGNDNAVVVTSVGVPICSMGIEVDWLCGVTTQSGIRWIGVLTRTKGLKALAPTDLC